MFRYLIAVTLSLYAVQFCMYWTILELQLGGAAGATLAFVFAAAYLPTVLIAPAASRMGADGRAHRAAFGGHLLAAMGVALILLVIGQPLSWVVAAVLAYGVGLGFLPTARWQMIEQSLPTAAHPRAIAIVNAMTVLAISTTPLAFAVVAAPGASPIFPIASVVFACVAAGAFLSVGRSARSGAAESDGLGTDTRASAAAPSDRFALLLSVAFAASLIGPVQSLLPALLQSEYGIQGLQRHLLLSLPGVGMLLGAPLAILLTRSGVFPARSLIVLATVAMASIPFAGTPRAIASDAASPAVSSLRIIGALVVVTGILASVILSTAHAVAHAGLPGEQRAAWNARLVQVTFAGPAALSAASGALSLLASPPYAFAAASIACGVGCVGLLTWRRSREPAGPRRRAGWRSA